MSLTPDNDADYALLGTWSDMFAVTAGCGYSAGQVHYLLISFRDQPPVMATRQVGSETRNQEEAPAAEKLYKLFAQDATIGDLARQGLTELARQLGKFRPHECTIPMSTLEIAEAVQRYACEYVARCGKPR